MRIAYLARSVVPSSTANSVHVMRMCAAFADLGHEVDVYVRRGPGSDEDARAWYGTRAPLALHRVAGASLPHVSGPVFAAKARWSLRRDGPYELLYSRDRVALALVLAGRSGRVPAVFESHQPPHPRPLQLLEQRLVSHAALRRVVVISRPLRDEYRRRLRSLPDGDVVVAPDGADVNDEEPRQLRSRPNEVVVGYAGSMWVGRGIDLVLELARRVPDAAFHVIGGEPDQVTRAARTAADNVTLHGHVAPAEVPGYLRAFDIALAPYERHVAAAGTGPSDTARWMSPMKVFEYMAAGCAIVASDLPALRDVLRPEDNCLLREPDDVDAWQDAIVTLVKDRSRRRDLGARARRDLVEHYTWRRRAERVLDGL